MESVAAPTLLARRLDRLKSGAGPPRAPALSSATPDHAARLADNLGGSVWRSSGGAVVSVEATVERVVDVERLRRMPYPFDPARPLVCLDLETTGLATAAGTLAFVVGVGIFQAQTVRVVQLVLPDHAGELALLDALAALLPPDAWLVTYNGKCFDWPLLTARYRLHRRAPPAHSGHLDLLPISRQLWKHRLGSARLAIVEAALCGVARADDLPGHLIPERYFGYLRTRDGRQLRAVVDHNRQDVVSLAQLLGVLADLAAPGGWDRAHPGDLIGLARGFARRRRIEEALAVVDAALSSPTWRTGLEGAAPLHRRLSAERARLLARLGRRDDAFAAWSDIARRGGPGAGIAWLAVARYREHRLRDIAGAIAACQEAATIAERSRAWGEPLRAVEEDLVRRLARLRRLSFRRRPFSRGVGRAA